MARRLTAYHQGAHVEISAAGALTIRPARGPRVELDAATTAAIVAALSAPHWRQRLASLLAAADTSRIAVVAVDPIAPEALSI